MKLLNWLTAPTPGSAEAESRAIIATVGFVAAAIAIGAVFGEAGVVLTLGPALIYIIIKMAMSGLK